MASKKRSSLGGTVTDDSSPPLTTMLTFDNNSATSGWRLSSTAGKPRWIQDSEGNIICWPVMLMDFDRANTVQQPLGGMSIRDPTTIGNRAAVSASPSASGVTDATFGLVINSRLMKLDTTTAKWWGVGMNYYGRSVSAVDTANTVNITYKNKNDLHSHLSIHFATSAGTATLTVLVSSDGTNFLTIDAAAAAAAGVLDYGPASVGATLGISPLSFPYIRITVGTAGAGNTTTLTYGLA